MLNSGINQVLELLYFLQFSDKVDAKQEIIGTIATYEFLVKYFFSNKSSRKDKFEIIK